MALRPQYQDNQNTPHHLGSFQKKPIPARLHLVGLCPPVPLGYVFLRSFPILSLTQKIALVSELSLQPKSINRRSVAIRFSSRGPGGVSYKNPNAALLLSWFVAAASVEILIRLHQLLLHIIALLTVYMSITVPVVVPYAIPFITSMMPIARFTSTSACHYTHLLRALTSYCYFMSDILPLLSPDLL